MKALVVTTDHKLEMWDVAKPEIGPYEALGRILACGICGSTDRELIAGTQPYNSDYPAILGHESIGEIIEVGAKVTRFKVGDRVTRTLAILPGDSRDGLYSCWGGFAEYGIVRDWEALQRDGIGGPDYTAMRQNVVPEYLTTAQAVVSICLGETASAFWTLPPVGGKSVCVSGTGIAGLSFALWAKLAGARNVIVLGRRQAKLDAALAVAADQAVNVTEGDTAQAVREANGGAGVDLYIEAVGAADQLQLALSVLERGGIMAIYGVPPGLGYDARWSMGNGDTRIIALPTEEHKGYPWVAEMIRRGHIPTDKLMTNQWPLEQFEQAFREIEEGKVVKGMLVMG
jgi:threonine dehydrogenase-like Zn-dependent dehydrogenase